MGFRILLKAAPAELLKLLKAALEDLNYTPLFPDDEQLCWSDGDAVAHFFESKTPSLVINFPRFETAPSAEQELAGVERLVQHCRERAIPLLHISTYRVFGDGCSTEALNETDLPQPSDDLGRNLLAMEQAIAKAPLHMILRVGWMLDGTYESLLATLMPKLLRADDIHVSDHNYGAPIQKRFVAKVLVALCQQMLCGAENWGVFHLRSSDTCSEAEFCDNVVRLINQERHQHGDLNPVVMPHVTTVGDARRSFVGNANLQGQRLTDNFGIQLPSWRNGLKTLVRRYLERHKDLAAG